MVCTATLVVGLFCTEGRAMLNGQYIAVPNGKVVGLLLYDTESQCLGRVDLSTIFALIQNRPVPLMSASPNMRREVYVMRNGRPARIMNADFSKWQDCTIDERNLGKINRELPFMCTTCKTEHLPCYTVHPNTGQILGPVPRVRCVATEVGKLVGAGKFQTLGYLITEGLDLAYCTRDELLARVECGELELCNLERCTTKNGDSYLRDIGDDIPEISYARYITIEGYKEPPISLSVAYKEGYIARAENPQQIRPGTSGYIFVPQGVFRILKPFRTYLYNKLACYTPYSNEEIMLKGYVSKKKISMSYVAPNGSDMPVKGGINRVVRNYNH